MEKFFENLRIFKTQSDRNNDHAESSSSGRGPSKYPDSNSDLGGRSKRIDGISNIIEEARLKFSNFVASNINIGFDHEINTNTAIYSKVKYQFNINTIDHIEEAIRQGHEIFSNFSDTDYSNGIKILIAAKIIMCGANPSSDSRVFLCTPGIVLGLIGMLEQIQNSNPGQKKEVASLLGETVLLLRDIGRWSILNSEDDKKEITNEIKSLVSGDMVARRLVQIAVKHGEICMKQLLKIAVGHPQGAFSGHLYLSNMLMNFHPNKSNLRVEDFAEGSTLERVSQPCLRRSSDAGLVGELLIASIQSGDPNVMDRVIADGLADIVLAAHGTAFSEFEKIYPQARNYAARTSHLNSLRIPELPSEVWD